MNHHQQPPRPPTRRPPLGEATRRVNNAHQSQNSFPTKPSLPHHESLRPEGLLQVRTTASGSPLSQEEYHPLQEFRRAGSPNSNVANPRLSAISKEYPGSESNRNSQISTVSTNASDGKRLKACIGPWKLGKTLGKGATARVRLARHAFTGQEAAIKIVQKKNAQLSQAGSLAALDQAESMLPDYGDGLRRMPIGIEREVAIMKLIQHPNIMKLYDIWENRTEIYLVLEYVDNGELFEHISANGRLEEEEAMKYFRQILSAVGYCHSFKICHRDLKPENILLTKEGEIKIADFGMAALHQGPDHKLKTSCGSPHYAAPELIKGSTYHGDKVDIWSMGVILYATLAGRLPFDVEGSGKEWLPSLLMKIRKGSYDMAPEFSEDAASLIWRILQVNPRDRINLSQIWKHPLVRKYDYLDNYGEGMPPASPSAKSCGRPVLRRSDINRELLRHLRSLWHRLSEQQLMDALLNEEPNDQKLFYSLLLKYRDTQLENYTPDLGYSSSDYHHVRPLALTKTYSTRNFHQPKSKGHGRQISRFTVISNVAETEQSYDPFKASRPQHLDSRRGADKARITIHRTQPSAHETDGDKTTSKAKPRQFSNASVSMASGSSRGRHLAPPRGFQSRSSLASSTRSRNSAPYVRVTVGHKRGVSFSHTRKRSNGSQRNISAPPAGGFERHSNHTEVTDDGGDILRPVAGTSLSTNYIRSRKNQSAMSRPLLPITKSKRTSQLWTDDVRQLSTSLAKDCDEAFNRSSVISSNEVHGRNIKMLSSTEESKLVKKSSVAGPSGSQITTTNQKGKRASLSSRPLPPPPARSESVKMELMEARLQAELRKKIGGDESPGYLDRMVSHIDRLIQPSSPLNTQTDRRSLSAPVDSKAVTSVRPLPSIHEARKEEESPRRPVDCDQFMDHHQRKEAKTSRNASAPEPRKSARNYVGDRFARTDTNMRDTIRVVNPSSPSSPIKVPAPLTIRKKSSHCGPSTPFRTGNGMTLGNNSNSSRHPQSVLEFRQNHASSSKLDVGSDLGRIEEGPHDDSFANDSNAGTIVKKKSTWFKRNSKTGEDQDWKMSIGGVNTIPSQSSSNDIVRQRPEAPLPFAPKKKGFSLGRLFRKRPSKTDMTLGEDDSFDNQSDQDSIEAQRPTHLRCAINSDELKRRQIEPQRNWLAKLFNVKPASRFICFAVSKNRARQEITTILKEWRRYGIRDVQVDKGRNVVFARVAAKNYLDMKEVAFAGETMTVIEHGKRSRLSIARFTQERGAASSFQKVVEILETVLKCRGMLVGDERKKRRMVKTLNSA